MMIGLSIYIGYHARTRYGTHMQKYGPVYMTILSSFLVMADLTRHILEDYEVWPERMSNGWGSGEYQENCATEDMDCLSTVGILFTIVFTYSGFLFLAIATLWNANICDKLKDMKAEWRRLRGTSGSVP